MKPTVTREEAIELWNLLRGQGFQKSVDIPMDNKRKIRAICSAYPEHFLSSQKGYCLVSEARPEDIENAVADLRSRCREMTRRADALESVYRNRFQQELPV